MASRARVPRRYLESLAAPQCITLSMPLPDASREQVGPTWRCGMQVGLLLHADRGVDAVIEEAKLADQQGYDSVWLGDHIMIPQFPLDALTLMTAVGASTERVRLVWSMLNVNFRYPAMLAKVLATLDQITKGRVICSLGSGSSPAEHVAYNIPVQELHDDRVEYTREVVQLLKELWTHPAPASTTFMGQQVQVKELAFAPEPYQ